MTQGAGEHTCRHEWYQGQCVHCEILVKTYRATPSSKAELLNEALLEVLPPPLGNDYAYGKGWNDARSRTKERIDALIAKAEGKS